MDLSDVYEPPKTESLPPSQQPGSSKLIRRIIGWGVSLLVIGILVGMLLPPVTRGVRPAARRVVCQNNMRQLTLALLNYEDANGHFPPAYVADENGKPMHSWRVLILPYLDEQDLFERYSMEEAWDGPNNKLLAGEFVQAFNCPGHFSDAHESNHTNYCLVTGPGTLFDADQTCEFGDIRDGSSKSAILVEVNRGDIHWMEPRDLSVDEAVAVFAQASAGDRASNHKGVQNVSFADGSTVSLENSLTRDELVQMFLIADENSDQN